MSEFSDKTILITGGTGSFGHALLTYLLKTSRDYKEVRIFSRDELKQDVMRNEYRSSQIKFYIGDIRDRSAVDEVVQGVDLIFHAAALKQVPSCEFFPIQAVMTNIQGSANVMESAVANGVSKVVCLSTDKAVYPINAMGMTKALMEKLIQSNSRKGWPSRTSICGVRYGNVLCSRGSVIPLFIKQIKENKELTITAPMMTRFLLSLDRAIELVVFALQKGNPGDLFIRKAPAATVENIAIALKRIFHSSTPVKIIGMRHGEKIFETLATREELCRAEDLGDYFRVPMDDRDLNYDKYFIEGDLQEMEKNDYTSHNTRRLELPELEELLASLPEVQSELQNYPHMVLTK